MTAFDYAKAKATADRLIQRFGQSGHLRRIAATGPAYDRSPGAATDHACRFAVVDYMATEIDGTRVLATDKKVYLAKGSLTIEPKASDVLVEADSSVYKIVSVAPLSPAGVVVVYELQVRR